MCPVARRLVNKRALVNSRWTIRPVRPNGKALPSISAISAMSRTEVSNMDHVFFEQVFPFVVIVLRKLNIVFFVKILSMTC